jgi:hypothetical protein
VEEVGGGSGGGGVGGEIIVRTVLMGDGWRELVTFSIWWRGGGNNTCWHHLVCKDRNWYKKRWILH